MSTRILARRGRATAALGLTALALSAGAALAATAGDLDPSFDDDGKLVLPFKITPGGRAAPARRQGPDDRRGQPDGRAAQRGRLAGPELRRRRRRHRLHRRQPSARRRCSPTGSSWWPVRAVSSAVAVARLDTDGSLDESFGPGGPDGDGRRVYTGLQVWSADAMVVQPDGRIAIAGQSAHAGLTVSRLETDGTPDGTELRLLRRGYVTGRRDPGRQVRPRRLRGDLRHDRLRPRGRALRGRRPAGQVARRQGQRAVRPHRPRRRAGRACSSRPTARSSSPRTSGTAQKHMTVMRLTTTGALDTTFAGDGTATPSSLGRRSPPAPRSSPTARSCRGHARAEQDFIAARLDSDGAPDRSFGTDGKMPSRLRRHPPAVRGGAPARRQARDRRPHGRGEPHR